MPRFLVQCILAVEAESPDDARGVVLEEASSARWYPVKDLRTILGVWPDRRDPDALPGFQDGNGMDAHAWEPVDDDADDTNSGQCGHGVGFDEDCEACEGYLDFDHPEG